MVECSYIIGPHVDAVVPALGRQSVLQVYPPCPDYKTPISGNFFDLNVHDVGIMWRKVLYIADLFCLHGNIRPGNITISLFFGAFKLFFDFLYF